MTFNRSTALAAVPLGAARHFTYTAEKLLAAAQLILPHLESGRPLKLARTGHGSGIEGSKAAAADPANSGIRREPDLPEHEEIEPSRTIPQGEFDFPDEDGGDADGARNRQLADRLRHVARQASLDPEDGIDL